MKINMLKQLIDDASLSLLQGKEGEANHKLSKVYNELLILTPFLKPESLAHLSQIMEIMHDAQQRRDYIYLVDIIKYSLPNLLNNSMKL